MVLDADECHFMCLGEDTENKTFIFDNSIFNNSNEEKILGITIDKKLNFKVTLKFYVKKHPEERSFIKAFN